LIEKRDTRRTPGCNNSFGRSFLEMFFGSEEDYFIINIWIKEIYARRRFEF
jgi:hypothetical protein